MNEIITEHSIVSLLKRSESIVNVVGSIGDGPVDNNININAQSNQSRRAEEQSRPEQTRAEQSRAEQSIDVFSIV